MGLQTRRDPKQRSPLRFSQRGRDPAAPARLAATRGYRSFRPTDNQTELPRDHKPSKNPALRVLRTVAKSAGYQRLPVAVSPIPADTLPKLPDPFLRLRRLRDRYEPAPLSDLNRGNSDLTNVSSRKHLAELSTPITEMIVGDYVMPQEPSNSCQRVPEVHRSDIPDVHRLRNIRRAEVNDDRFRLGYSYHTKMQSESQLLKTVRKKLRRKHEIDKS